MGDEYAYTREYLERKINDKIVQHDLVGLSIGLVIDKGTELLGYSGYLFRKVD